MAISKKRLALLRELEYLVGKECFHPKMQNRGAGGALESIGRQYRYPVTFIEPDGTTIKRRGSYEDLPARVQMTGHYKIGSNRLGIMQALSEVLDYLEEHCALKI